MGGGQKFGIDRRGKLDCASSLLHNELISFIDFYVHPFAEWFTYLGTQDLNNVSTAKPLNLSLCVREVVLDILILPSNFQHLLCGDLWVLRRFHTCKFNLIEHLMNKLGLVIGIIAMLRAPNALKFE